MYLKNNHLLNLVHTNLRLAVNVDILKVYIFLAIHSFNIKFDRMDVPQMLSFRFLTLREHFSGVLSTQIDHLQICMNI